MTEIENSRYDYYHKFFSVFLLIFLFVILGCGATKSVVQKMKPSTPDLKKRVMVLPFVDQAGLGSGKASEITLNFVGLLGKSPHLLLYETPKSLSLPIGVGNPEVGITVNPELIKTAEELGVNVLITGVLNPIETKTNKTGIWPFRKTKKNYEISMILNVVNVSTGCLYLSRLESEEVSFSNDELQGRSEDDITDQALKKALPRILKQQASAVAKNLSKQAWSGKILAVADNSITINAGRDLGVYPGQLFTVFAKGESIVCRTGRAVDLLGKKVGKIRTTSVTEKQSLAMPEAQAAFLPGQIVMSKP